MLPRNDSLPARPLIPLAARATPKISVQRIESDTIGTPNRNFGLEGSAV